MLRRPARFSSGVVAVDSATADLARVLVEFEPLGIISLKGKSVPVEIHTPLGPAAASVRRDKNRLLFELFDDLYFRESQAVWHVGTIVAFGAYVSFMSAVVGESFSAQTD